MQSLRGDDGLNTCAVGSLWDLSARNSGPPSSTQDALETTDVFKRSGDLTAVSDPSSSAAEEVCDADGSVERQLKLFDSVSDLTVNGGVF